MTQTVLRIDASARREASHSRALADRVLACMTPTRVIRRDLAEGLPHLDPGWLAASATPDEARGDAERAALALSDTLIEELRAADTIVIALPIYNFGVPSTLKAWVDMVARARITFRYTENGPEGLLSGKRAILVVASGGTAVDGPVDFATPWMRHVLGFIGITDVRVVRADRLMVDAEASLARAEADIAALCETCTRIAA